MARVISRPVPPVRQVKFDCVIGADLHVREDVPVCRTDDYLTAQFGKMAFIQKLCKDNDNAPFLCAGDLFDNWKPSPWLLSKCLELLPLLTIVVPGQHDLAQHSLAELPKTGLQTLAQAGRVFILSGGFERVLGGPGGPLASVSGYAYGETAKDAVRDEENTKYILLWHHLTCSGSQPWPGARADEITDIRGKLRGLRGYDLVVTGDNHQQFYSQGIFSRVVFVNPGSMMRMSADQVDFEPAVFGWCASDNSITRIPLPIKKGVVSREHLGGEKKETRDKRMEAYICRAKRQFESHLSFVENLKTHIKQNKISPDVEALIWKATEGNDNAK